MVDPSQVNFVAPAGLKPGRGIIAITSTGGRTATIPMEVNAIAPGLFAANANGKGVAAAVALWLAADGSQTSQVIFECAAGKCRGSARYGAESGRMICCCSAVRRLHGGCEIGGQAADVLGVAAQSEYLDWTR
jgi:uncharacterized protein (TIGR03437 family)